MRAWPLPDWLWQTPSAPLHRRRLLPTSTPAARVASLSLLILAGQPLPSLGFGFARAAMDESGSDDVLDLVLERVDSHVSLIRAAAVCRRWRRAIADAAFLRRYRSLHAPPASGYYHNPSFPGGTEGKRRGSLLVLFDDSEPASLVLVVCEPLTQRYRMIPPPPDSDSLDILGSFLLDADEVGSCISISNFRLLCLYDCNGVILTSIFTAGSSWSEKNTTPMAPSFTPSLWPSHILGRASGSWYFYTLDKSRMLFNLNGSTGELACSVLPAIEGIEDWDRHIQTRSCVLTEGCDGKPRIIVAFDDTMKVFTRLDSTKWALEKKILLSEATCSLLGYPSSFLGHGISTIGVGFIILSQMFGEPWPFSVNLETMEAAPAAKDMGERAYQCELPWPPDLHACLEPLTGMYTLLPRF
ncbi:unnamed protein product [Urochloa decumbens]|uniref:F-box domain-containing protein n=1 Tax=Urochloa decumbens TaxID=240449 RepID=A0ABC8VWW4_9POAL